MPRSSFARPWTPSIHQPCLGPRRAPRGRSSTSVRGDGSGRRKKKARREKLPFMRRINSIFTPRDLSFSFGSPSQARHASNLVAQYRERQAAGDKHAGPPSSAGEKAGAVSGFFPLLPFHPPHPGLLPGCHNEPLVAKQWRVLKHRSLQSYTIFECTQWKSFFLTEVCKSDLVRNAREQFLGGCNSGGWAARALAVFQTPPLLQPLSLCPWAGHFTHMASYECGRMFGYTHT